MAEPMAQVNLSRTLRLRGGCQWAVQHACLLPTVEGELFMFRPSDRFYGSCFVRAKSIYRLHVLFITYC